MYAHIHTCAQDQIFLTRATELATGLLPAFGSKSGIPFSDVNLASGKAHPPSGSRDSSTSEVNSLAAWCGGHCGMGPKAMSLLPAYMPVTVTAPQRTAPHRSLAAAESARLACPGQAGLAAHTAVW